MTAYESFNGTSVGCVTLIDEFARARRTRGLMPAPIPPLRFSLVAHEDQGNLVPLDPPIDLDPRSGPSGAYLFADEARIGGLPLMRIESGKYRIRIESDFYQTIETLIDWPAVPPPAPLSLQPGFGYPFPDVTVPAAKLSLVRGGVLQEGDGAPAVNALVEVIDPPNLGPLAASTTDTRGAWVLALALPQMPADQTLKLRITLSNGGGVIVVPNVQVHPSAENSVPQTALRGQVLTNNGRAIAGAEITVDAMPGKRVRSARDGSWFFYFGLNQPDGAAQVTANAPNGVNQSQNVQIFQRKTIVVPTFRFAMN